MKEGDCDWMSKVNEKVSELEQKHGIEVSHIFGSSRLNIQTVSDFRTRIAIPYIDKLLENIKHRFSDNALKVVTAMSHSNC